MPGQGVIVGVGALAWPSGFEAADPAALAELGVGKVVTLTSTYDHRIIQGAHSGLFLATSRSASPEGTTSTTRSSATSRSPTSPPAGARSSSRPPGATPTRRAREVHVQELINMYRVRGHLDRAPRPTRRRTSGSRIPSSTSRTTACRSGTSRSFLTDGLGGHDVRPSRRSSRSCATLLPLDRHRVHAHPGPRAEAVDPVARRGRLDDAEPEEQRRLLDRLNAAEVFERFLHTRYVGQKRFGLEGAESTIVAARRALRRGGTARRAGRGDRDGAPRPAERAGQRRRQELQRDLQGVRGEPRPRQRRRAPVT